jgi:exonuclease III
MKYNLLTVLIGLTFAASAQVTKVGNDTLLDVAGWNVEWFGDASNGPSNEPLQYTNVKSVIQNTDIDVWGLAEVSNTTTFTTLLTDLTAYDGVNSSFSQTQKMALIWKKSKFKLITAGNILTESTYNYQFAGRPPLEVMLETTDHEVKNDTIFFYVVHLKANSGSGDQSSYDRRKDAVVTLKKFLDQNRNGQKCIVLGDWNDDVDESVVYINPAYLASPFLNFVNDSARYFYATMQLSKAGENSYVSSANMIDHQLMTTALKDSFYVAGSSVVMKQTASQISGYSSNTSDHYPVLARYSFNRKLPTPPTGLNQIDLTSIRLYPNPASDYLTIEGIQHASTIYMVNIAGIRFPVTVGANGIVDLKEIPEGLYMIMITNQGQSQALSRILINR